MLTRIVLATLPYVPKFVMRRIAARYIAGETLPEALERLRSLQARGHAGILDVLGEGISDERQARAVAAEYCQAATALAAAGLDCYVSVKPTHVGLTISEDLAHELYASIARRARELGLFLRVEMEDHPTTDGTLRVFERLRRDHENVGIVLQARLFRTIDDIDRLAQGDRLARGPLDVRLVKGIYLEPASIAHTDPIRIREAFVQCVEKLCARGARLALATHDEHLADTCIEVLRAARRDRESYEFQVLLGVREELWERWKGGGHRVRVYVPYGPDWRAYSLRRMRKNPQIVGHVLRHLLGRA
ncbi:MAG: proline dehydrogenase family protein [Planctomycetes bacterium]|nr:proline dehydrogenase family protein [Planctomycetota bacterium]